jgi:hypothetical protein
MEKDEVVRTGAVHGKKLMIVEVFVKGVGAA